MYWQWGSKGAMDPGVSKANGCSTTREIHHQYGFIGPLRHLGPSATAPAAPLEATPMCTGALLFGLKKYSNVLQIVRNWGFL